jgi:hypothetical protein
VVHVLYLVYLRRRAQIAQFGAARAGRLGDQTAEHNGGYGASRNSKVTTQRDVGAGLAALPGPDAGRRP